MKRINFVINSKKFRTRRNHILSSMLKVIRFFKLRKAIDAISLKIISSLPTDVKKGLIINTIDNDRLFLPCCS